jgi:HD-GYP domain-containing protein (c-di-GMP phosphodiesterase class II)
MTHLGETQVNRIEADDARRHPSVMLLYQGALLAVAAILLVLAWKHGFGDPLAVLGLAAVAALAERGRVRLVSTTEVSISVLPTVFAAAVFGPLAAMFVAAGSFMGDFPVSWQRARGFQRPSDGQILKWGIYTSVRAIYGAAAGFAASAVSPLVASGVTRLVIATVTAALVAEPLDVVFAALTLRLRSARPWPFLRMYVPMVLVSVSLYTPIVALLAVAYANVSPWTLALFFLPALAAQRLFGLYQEQRQLTDQLVTANTDLETANISFATALVTTLDARDRYTAGHSAAVAIYARDIAQRMGLPEVICNKAHLAGLEHDIGKIGLSAGVLEKPGALTLEERREMQRHSEIGERILAKVATYAEIASIVRYHHERVDGEGYPDGLAGDDIPQISRIIAVADAYNAMTSDRPYRDAMPSRVARLRLAQAVESQFDTSVVAAFEALLAGASEDYRLAATPEFTFDWQRDAIAVHDISAVPVAAALSA